MNIVVLAGGISTERAVSIVSGTMVCKALRQKGHRAVLIDVYCGDERLELEGAGMETLFPETYDIDAQAAYMHTFDDQIADMKASGRAFFGANVLKLCQKAEVVFMALHGEDGEGGKVQAVFDLFGIKYTGTDSFSSALAMDKSITKQLFLQNGVPTPKSHLLTGKDDPYKPEFPCVVKVSGGGSSVGVYIVQNETEYEDAVQDAFHYDAKVLVEQYIKGREFTDCVIDGKPYPVVEIAPVSGFYDYKNKYQAGSTVETCPAKISDELTKKIQDTALKAYQVLGIKTYARMDVLMDENGDVYCLEANTLPGMTPTSLIPQEAAVLGISYGELCELIIEISLKKYA